MIVIFYLSYKYNVKSGTNTAPSYMISAAMVNGYVFISTPFHSSNHSQVGLENGSP